MASVKRTFTLPEEFSKKFDETVPKQERSQAVLLALEEYIKRRKREKALEFLDNIEPWSNPEDISGQAFPLGFPLIACLRLILPV